MSDANALVPQEFSDLVGTYQADPGDLARPQDGYAVSGAVWLRGLPRLLAALLDEWELTPDGPTRWGLCAVVLPVVGPAGPAVLKVTWPHREAAGEHLALRRWDGRGAVQLLRADPRRFALLLERLDPPPSASPGSSDIPASLADLPDDEGCAVVGDLLTRLRTLAIARIPTLSGHLARMRERPVVTDALPRRFVEQAHRLAVDLAADADLDAWLLHTDLQVDNVLRGGREPWLAIDPKPMAGDRAYEVTPSLWNRVEELGTGSTFRWNVRHRLEVVCEHAGIDEDRAKAWTIVRAMDDTRAEPPGSARASRAVAMVKAMND